MKQDTTYSERETQRRRDEAVRRALNTPPKPHSAEPKRKRQTDEELKAEAIDNWNDEGGAPKRKRKAEKK
jgi:hypothetical protein